MTDYNVKYTDSTVPPIVIPETDVNSITVDVTLFGRINLEYGQDLNESLLNIVENFSCPELDVGSDNLYTAVPDLSQTSKKQLASPTLGQFWYNSTRSLIYYWDDTKDVPSHPGWHPIPLRDNYAANWGMIYDGNQLPKPVSSITGHVFDYEECIWSVAPADLNGGNINFMSCRTDSQAVVDMKYRMVEGGTMIPGLANYLIIGIRGSTRKTDWDILPSPTPMTTPLPTPTPTATMSVSGTPSVTPTRTGTPASTVGVTPSGTPAVTPTVTPTRTGTPAGTPPVTQTQTPAPTVGVTPSGTPAVTPTRTGTPVGTPPVTATSTPAVTPTRTGTPPVTPSPTPQVSPLPAMCDCPNRWYDGSGYLDSYGNYNSLEACELDLEPGQSCEIGGLNCWQRVNHLDPRHVDCALVGE